MTDETRGASSGSLPPPGWWQASDGNWYPPDQHPSAQPVTPSPPTYSLPPTVPPASRPPLPEGARVVFKKRRRWPWILGIAMLLVVVIGAIAGGGQSDGPEAAATGTDTGTPAGEAPPTEPAPAPTEPAPAPTEPAPAPTEPAPDEPVAVTNARRSAQAYLAMSGFSRQGLIGQLEFEGYSASDAAAAVDSMDVDWNEQAARSAEGYLAISGFSRQGLIDQLVFEGFTPEQAAHGASSVGL